MSDFLRHLMIHWCFATNTLISDLRPYGIDLCFGHHLWTYLKVSEQGEQMLLTGLHDSETIRLCVLGLCDEVHSVDVQ